MIFWKITKTCHELVVQLSKFFFLKKHYRQLFISPLRKRSTYRSKIKLKEKLKENLINIPHWSNCFKVLKLMFFNTTAINVNHMYLYVQNCYTILFHFLELCVAYFCPKNWIPLIFLRLSNLTSWLERSPNFEFKWG